MNNIDLISFSFIIIFASIGVHNEPFSLLWMFKAAIVSSIPFLSGK